MGRHCLFFVLDGSHQFCHDSSTLLFPFVPVGNSVLDVLVRRYSKHTAVLQLASKRNDVEIKEPKPGG